MRVRGLGFRVEGLRKRAGLPYGFNKGFGFGGVKGMFWRGLQGVTGDEAFFAPQKWLRGTLWGASSMLQGSCRAFETAFLSCMKGAG